MRIQHNIMAMNAYRNYNINTSAVSKNLEKLSSGYKINRAGDDAAGLAISEKMRAQITGLDAASKNVKDGISLVKTAEGAMQEIQDMLNRMDYLATQSANGTYQNEVDRENLQAEVEQLKSEINRIADSANFNGIKLLDGSLATKGGATTVEIGGNAVSMSAPGGKAAFEASAAIAQGDAGSKEGDVFKFTVGLADGSSVDASVTLKKNAETGEYHLEAADGMKYTVAASTGVATLKEVATAIKGELDKSSLAKDFNITQTGTDNGIFKFEAKVNGSDVPQITSMDYAQYKNGTVEQVATPPDIAVKTTLGLDDGREIDASKLVLYDGTNYDDAVFTINGHKFVLMTGDMEYDESDPTKHQAANAAAGLGTDVTILYSDKNAKPQESGITDTSNGLYATDANFDQNIKKIAEVTGLNVTDAVTEAANSNGIDAGAGIRLSKGAGATGGLVLQIGDTSDSYNQLRVGVDDMHTKALGIDKLNIGNQKDAANAIQTIKNAINKVSSVRGTLGATQNRLEHTQNNLSVMKENIQDAESTIRDVDIAEEMMAYTKNNILVQSAQAMLAQANQIPQGVLQLLG